MTKRSLYKKSNVYILLKNIYCSYCYWLCSKHSAAVTITTKGDNVTEWKEHLHMNTLIIDKNMSRESLYSPSWRIELLLCVTPRLLLWLRVDTGAYTHRSQLLLLLLLHRIYLRSFTYLKLFVYLKVSIHSLGSCGAAVTLQLSLLSCLKLLLNDKQFNLFFFISFHVKIYCTSCPIKTSFHIGVNL